jgi:hypothetical protein
MKMHWGYHAWRLQTFCGATPAFAWAATRVEAQCHVAAADEVAWWRASLTVLERLSAQHPPLAHWLRCAKNLEMAKPASPLEMGWNALHAALGCPDYPSASNSGAAADSPTHLVVHLACPYGDFTQLSLRLVGTWLSWGHAAWQQGRITLNRAQLARWLAEFDQLPTSLPGPSLTSMHQRLWQQGIAWEWLGEGRTRIGEGARQQVITGVPTELPLNALEAWHVPIYTVTGSVGKTTTARLLSQLLQDSGNTLALAASDGAWIGSQQVMEGDCIGGVTARALLKSPLVQAAVFEQGRGGIVKQGVPYARSDVGILLNVQPVHLGLDGIETVEQMANTKALGLQPARLWVLNYDDEQCVRVARRHLPEQTLWFSVSAPEGMLEGPEQQCHWLR